MMQRLLKDFACLRLGAMTIIIIVVVVVAVAVVIICLFNVGNKSMC